MNRKPCKRTFFAAILVGLLAVSGGTAHASSGYLNSFNSTYGTSATRLNTCNLCHTAVPSLNGYGTAYAAAGHSFAAIEAADSDGDGFSNLAEITARTFPGDPADKPAVAGTPALTVSPAADAFGSVTVGLSSAPVVNTLSNSGTASLSITGMTLSDTADYVLDPAGGSAPCGATSTTLAPGVSCTVSVAFAPKTAGSRPGTLTLSSNDPAGADVVTLSGSGVAAAVPKVSVAPSSVAFGSVAVGGSSAPAVTTIANTGTASLSVASIALSNATDFSLNLDGGTNPCATAAKTLAAGASCTVSTVFNPKSSGAKSASLAVSSNDPATPVAAVPMTGTGAVAAAPRVSASPSALSMGSVAVGSSSAPQSLAVSNAGTANLSIGALSLGGANAAEFGLQNDRCSAQTLAPAASCTVQVVFSPASAAAKGATLSIPSNDAATPLLGVAVSGNGVSQANAAPTVVSTSPAANAANVPLNATAGATFSESMDPSTLNASTFTLAANGAPVAGSVSYSGTTATFTPSAPLAAGTLHTATVTTGARDLGGLALASPRSWSFTTVSVVDNVDTDGDGCRNDEDDYPNDNRKATPRSSHGHGKIRVDVSSILGAYLTDTRAMPETAMSGRPAGWHFDEGMVSFRINGGSGSAPVTIGFDNAIPAGSRVYMAAPGGGFREVPGAVISGSTVTLPVSAEGSGSSAPSLTMGGTGTSAANVVGVASPDAAAPASSGGGCSAAPADAADPAGALGAAALLAAGLLLRKTGGRSAK